MDLDLEDLEPKLKEILYRCLEEVRATKAALYLLADTNDYRLATQYGFRDGLRTEVGFSDDLIDQLVTKRTPYFLNGLSEDSRFSEMLFDANTTRLLVAPVYSRGKLVGFIDLRDKAAQEPFRSEDIAKVQAIADQFVDLFAQHGLYGQRIPTLTNVRLPKIEQPEPEVTLRSVIEDARATVSRGVLAVPSPATSITEEEFRSGAALLPGILGLSHAVLAAVTAFGAAGGYQEIVARDEVTRDALDQFQARLNNWLHRRGETPEIARSTVQYPYGMTGASVGADRLASLLSAPVPVPIGHMVLSVAFEAPPDQECRTRLERFLRDIQRAMENGVSRRELQAANQRVAERLLEPDWERYPALAAHARRVADLCERFAKALGLAPAQVETVRICGLVHDVGMRLIDYPNLYRAASLTGEQVRMVREHPVVGAAIIGESALGTEVARAVYAHHERPDGTGYPEGVTVDKIPLAARVVQICEAYDAMTSNESYQNPVDPETALVKIQNAAGTQFDPDLAKRFVEIMSG